MQLFMIIPKNVQIRIYILHIYRDYYRDRDQVSVSSLFCTYVIPILLTDVSYSNV